MIRSIITNEQKEISLRNSKNNLSHFSWLMGDSRSMGVDIWRQSLAGTFSTILFGEVTQGAVLNTDVFHGRYDRYYITYEYSPQEDGDKKFTSEKEVTSTLFENYLVGDSIPIHYLLANPKISNIEENDPLQLQGLRLIMILSPVGLVLGLIILAVFLFRHLGWF